MLAAQIALLHHGARGLALEYGGRLEAELAGGLGTPRRRLACQLVGGRIRQPDRDHELAQPSTQRSLELGEGNRGAPRWRWAHPQQRQLHLPVVVVAREQQRRRGRARADRRAALAEQHAQRVLKEGVDAVLVRAAVLVAWFGRRLARRPDELLCLRLCELELGLRELDLLGHAAHEAGLAGRVAADTLLDPLRQRERLLLAPLVPHARVVRIHLLNLVCGHGVWELAVEPFEHALDALPTPAAVVVGESLLLLRVVLLGGRDERRLQAHVGVNARQARGAHVEAVSRARARRRRALARTGRNAPLAAEGRKKTTVILYRWGSCLLSSCVESNICVGSFACSLFLHE